MQVEGLSVDVDVDRERLAAHPKLPSSGTKVTVPGLGQRYSTSEFTGREEMT